MVAALLIAIGCSPDGSIPEDRSSGSNQGIRTDADLSYINSADTLPELLDESQLVVFAQRLTAPEVILLPDLGDRISVHGQSFRVIETFKGAAQESQLITVTRTKIANDQEPEEPPFDLPVYLLGLNDTHESYGVPAWVPVGGPDGRLPFDYSASGVLEVVVETADSLEQALVGDTLETVRQKLCSHIHCGP